MAQLISSNPTDIDKATIALAPIEAFAKYFYFGLAILIVLFASSVAIKDASITYWQTSAGTFLLALGVSLAVVAASSAVGCLLGFLFGIPRSLQRLVPNSPPARKPGGEGSPEAAGPAASARAFASNTSLEEISDWLTKIIIGVGLVQFQTLIAYLYKCALFAGSFVAAVSINANVDIGTLGYDPSVASPYFFALIIASLISSCLFGYLETRTRLTFIFVSTEKTLDSRNEKLELAAERPVATGTGGGGVAGEINLATPTTAEPATAEDEQIIRIPREQLEGTRQIVGWASAQARRGNYQVAEDALRDALQKTPNDNDIRVRIADIRQLRGNYSGAVEMISRAIANARDPKERTALMRRTLYSALFIPPPHGFRSAIQISDQLIRDGVTGDASVYAWRAAAFGQQYLWLKQNSGTPDKLSEAKDNALAAVKKVIEFAPAYNSTERALLRAMFDPDAEGTPREDGDDLEVFKDAKEFQDEIYRDRPTSGTGGN